MPKPGQKMTKLFLTCHHKIPPRYELTPVNYCNYKVLKHDDAILGNRRYLLPRNNIIRDVYDEELSNLAFQNSRLIIITDKPIKVNQSSINTIVVIVITFYHR